MIVIIQADKMVKQLYQNILNRQDHFDILKIKISMLNCSCKNDWTHTTVRATVSETAKALNNMLLAYALKIFLENIMKENMFPIKPMAKIKYKNIKRYSSISVRLVVIILSKTAVVSIVVILKSSASSVVLILKMVHPVVV